MINRYIFIKLAVLLLFIIPLFGQEADSVKTMALPDSLTNRPAQPELKQKRPKPYKLNPQWFDFEGRVYGSPDSLKKPVFDFQNMLLFSYHGFADVFRNQSTYQIFDFMESGKPRYVAGLHLLPHQSAIRMNGNLLNDPTHGLYSTRFISLDAVQQVEANSGTLNPMSQSAGLLEGTNVHYQRIINEQPYTRIMFRQGDFGFSNLDIEFGQKINDHMAIQLGGINKSYDLSGQQYHGVNYRAALNYQVSARLYANVRLNMNREDSFIQNANSSYRYFKYRESRDDLLADITYSPETDSREAWHIQTGISRTRRTNEFLLDSLLSRTRFERYFLNGGHNWDFKHFEIQTTLSGFQYKTWGNVYYQKYVDSGFDGRARLAYRLNDKITLTPDMSFHHLYENGSSLLPGFEAKWRGEQLGLNLKFEQAVRFPTKNEKFFKLREFSGNREIDYEKMTSYKMAASYQPSSLFELKSELVHRQISDEIRFDGTQFWNGGSRDFSYISGEGCINLYKFSFLAGGQVSDASIYVSPKRSSWLQLRYHDTWLKGAVIIDAVGAVHWYDSHNKMYYNPVVERFYWSDTRVEGYNVLSYKLVATVKDAQIYLSMDNPLSTEYTYISGYTQYYRRVRFGVNWVLWD